MSNPLTADGQPIPDGLIAAVDETVVEQQGGVTYVLAAVVFGDAHAALQDAKSLTANRTRPFHWHREGPTTRATAVELIDRHAIATRIVARRAGRQSQTAARGELLTELVAELANAGVGHIVIESRGRREDGRDRSVILTCLRELPTSALSYDRRTKAEAPALVSRRSRRRCPRVPHRRTISGLQLPSEHTHRDRHLLLALNNPGMRKPRLPS